MDQLKIWPLWTFMWYMQIVCLYAKVPVCFWEWELFQGIFFIFLVTFSIKPCPISIQCTKERALHWHLSDSLVASLGNEKWSNSLVKEDARLERFPPFFLKVQPRNETWKGPRPRSNYLHLKCEEGRLVVQNHPLANSLQRAACCLCFAGA